MLRVALFLGVLACAPAALACEGGDCPANCPMSSQTAQNDDVDAAAGTKIVLAIDGMHCGKCADHIAAALEAVDGVNAASVDYTTGRAKIAFDAKKTNVDALIAVVKQTDDFSAKVDDSKS